MTQTLRLRPTAMEDAKSLFDWRQDATFRRALADDGPIDLEGHLTWLERSLARLDRVLLIGEATRTDEAVGLVRYDETAPGAWRGRFAVAPPFRGRGWSLKLKAAMAAHMPDAAGAGPS